MFFDFIFINKIIVLMLFIGSYYRTIFSRKIIKLLSQCFAFFNTNVHFCALCVVRCALCVVRCALCVVRCACGRIVASTVRWFVA
ncbi:hypothetical protein DLR11_16250 [Salmonella enterica subsp. salamae]|nr:hypothetical protein [Salmonella enterica subsp. salamae]ECI3453349.1 hypothetical protein [Salmonella enterica subsp. salamae]